MGSTTVRIRPEDKERLRRLQDAWSAKPPSQTDMLSLTLEFALRRRDEFVLEACWQPLSQQEIARLDRMAKDLGPWNATDVDSVVYGEP